MDFDTWQEGCLLNEPNRTGSSVIDGYSFTPDAYLERRVRVRVRAGALARRLVSRDLYRGGGARLDAWLGLGLALGLG